MSFASKTRQSSIITVVVLLFLLTTAAFAVANDGTTAPEATETTVAVADVAADEEVVAPEVTEDTAAPETTDEVTEVSVEAEATVTTVAIDSVDAPLSAQAEAGGPLKGCEQAAPGPGGPYDSTCDGSPSLNGNGGGNATGKPCAGCVGSADDKNPPGQFPDGSDHNAGYECDRNSGVGKTNPAHTGCKPTTTTVPVTTTTLPCEATTTTTYQCETTTTVPLTTSTTVPVTTTTVVLGTTIVNPTTTTVLGTTIVNPTTTTDQVLPTLLTQVGQIGKPHPKKVLPKRTPPAPEPPDILPFTGSDPSGAIGLAGVLMALGGGVMLASDRAKRRYDY